jgi:hypothetical protein
MHGKTLGKYPKQFIWKAPKIILKKKKVEGNTPIINLLSTINKKM